jgi:methylmalonyl-CoA mutase N-terminal domain/subunit
MHVDEFAPRLAFYYVAQADFFEEIAKMRAVRRVYAKLMRERFGARNPESMRLRFIARPPPRRSPGRSRRSTSCAPGLQALAAVLGGAQSLHTNGMDEAFAIPDRGGDEDRLAHAADHRRRKRSRERRRSARRLVFRRKPDDAIRARHLRSAGRGRAPGGTIRAIEEGWFQQRIADFAYETAKRKASGAKPVVGVNRYVEPDERFDVEMHPYDPTTAERQIARLEQVRRERDAAKVNALLDRLVAVAADERENLLPATIELVEAGASMGDIVERLEGRVGNVPRTAGVLTPIAR